MSKESFANLIVSKLKSVVGNDGSKYSTNTASLAQSAIAEAITEYLIANTTITISYNGIATAGGADIIAADTMKIMGDCELSDTPSQFSAWVMALQTAIASAFIVQSPSTQGVITEFKPFSNMPGALQISQSALKTAHISNPQNPTLAVWSELCGGILNWLNSEAGKNAAAIGVVASRSGISTGSANLLSISVV